MCIFLLSFPVFVYADLRRPCRHLPPTPQLRARAAPGAQTSLRASAACPKPRRNATLQSSIFIQRLQIQSFALFFLSRRSPVSFILMPLRTLFMPTEAVAPSHLHSDLATHPTLLLPPIPAGSQSRRGPGQGHSTFATSVPVTPLEATPASPPISVASKRLTENVNPLEATLTKIRGGGLLPEPPVSLPISPPSCSEIVGNRIGVTRHSPLPFSRKHFPTLPRISIQMPEHSGKEALNHA
jgi:hypothetical protein